MADPQSTSWAQVWRLWADHRRVSAAVFSDLQRRGIDVPADAGDDLVHSFLVDRAPQALASYRPEVGGLESWLFVVFRRYVLGELRRRRRWDELLRKLEQEPSDTAAARDDSPVDLEAVRNALAGLDPIQQQAVELFFCPDGGSVRAISRTLRSYRGEYSDITGSGAPSSPFAGVPPARRKAPG